MKKYFRSFLNIDRVQYYINYELYANNSEIFLYKRVCFVIFTEINLPNEKLFLFNTLNEYGVIKKVFWI